MDLSRNIIKRYVAVTTPEKVTSNSDTRYGTVVNEGDELFVRIDGSSILTPVSSTIDLREGDRVLVLIKNHEATVLGSPTSVTARLEELRELGGEVVDLVNANKVVTGEIVAMQGLFEELTAKDVEITGELTANKATIEALTAENATINGKLTAYQADIEELQADKIDATEVAAKYATIEKLNAVDIKTDTLVSDYGNFKDLTTNKFSAYDADIENLETEKLDAKSADILYAQIDFANIDQAAITKIFSESGIIDDLVVSEGKITGELVGVTIKGDLIEGGTVVADKLVVKGSNGLYYKLNTDGVTTEAEQTEYNSLSGSVITAKSITATKIAVDDLVAFGATIGGFHITDDAIYSGVKESATNTTRGIYLDNTGQIAFGDSSNYLKYFKDTDGKWKLDISAAVIRLGASNKTVEDYIEEKADEISASAAQDAATPVLRIDSSRGTVFKNNSVSTILTVAIYKGGERITDTAAMKAAFGSGAYLQWHWQRLDEDRFGILSADDPKISNGGFTLTITPEDVDVKVTFMCELITN